MTTIVKRSGIAAVVTALMSTGLVTASPSPAQAVALDEPWVVTDTGYHDGGGCSGTPTGGDPDSEEPPSGNATVTSELDYAISGPGGTGTYTAKSKLVSGVAADADDVFASLTVSLQVELTTNAVAGCDGLVSASGDTDMGVHLPRAGSLTVAATGAAKAEETEVWVDRYADADRNVYLGSIYLEFEAFGPSTTTRVASGYYQIATRSYVSAHEEPEPDEVSSYTGTMTTTVSYAPDPKPGEALSGLNGKAKRFVKTGSQVDCGTGALDAKFKGKKKRIKKVKKAVFKAKLAGGGSKKVKKFKAKKIKPGKRFNLKPPAKTKKIKVVLKLKNGKKIKGKRSYNPCA